MEEARNAEPEAGRIEDHQHDQRSQGLQRQVPTQGTGGNFVLYLKILNVPKDFIRVKGKLLFY